MVKNIFKEHQTTSWKNNFAAYGRQKNLIFILNDMFLEISKKRLKKDLPLLINQINNIQKRLITKNIGE